MHYFSQNLHMHSTRLCSLCLSICLSVCQSVCQSVSLSVSLSASLLLPLSVVMASPRCCCCCSCWCYVVHTLVCIWLLPPSLFLSLSLSLPPPLSVCLSAPPSLSPSPSLCPSPRSIFLFLLFYRIPFTFCSLVLSACKVVLAVRILSNLVPHGATHEEKKRVSYAYSLL